MDVGWYKMNFELKNQIKILKKNLIYYIFFGC